MLEKNKMYLKERFELVYDRSGDLYNIVPLRQTTLSAYELDKTDVDYIKNLVNIYGKTKGHSAFPIISKYINEIKVINFPNYPLPGFVNIENIPYVNISALPVSLISDFSPTDMYTLFLYGISLYLFTTKGLIDASVEEHIASFYFALFMKVFGKKSGLTGSYRDLIPRLRFLIWMYTHCGVLGLEDTEIVRKKIALQSELTDINAVKADYDFKSIKQLLKSINQNRIIPLSETVFSKKMIDVGGINSLPIFEDPSRFFATLMCVTVQGNTIFSSYWSKVRTDLFQKLVYIGSKNMNRVA